MKKRNIMVTLVNVLWGSNTFDCGSLPLGLLSRTVNTKWFRQNLQRKIKSSQRCKIIISMVITNSIKFFERCNWRHFQSSKLPSLFLWLMTFGFNCYIILMSGFSHLIGFSFSFENLIKLVVVEEKYRFYFINSYTSTAELGISSDCSYVCKQSTT